MAVGRGIESGCAWIGGPARRGGVSTAGALPRQGDRASYSNFGGRVDISAPGRDGAVSDRIVSTSNDGFTTPGNPGYALEIGTSFAAPHVAGTASLMFARNANLTPGQVLGIVTGTARTFPPGSVCAQSGLCGAGLLDAGLALQSTPLITDKAPPGTVPVIESYRADNNHYIVIADPPPPPYSYPLSPSTSQH